MPKFTYKTYSYSPRTPQARMQRLVTGALPYPGPAAPVTSLTISGVVTRDGTVTSGIAVEFTSIGTVITNSSGIYSQTAAYTGYTGNGIPHYSAGSFTPSSRSYSSIAANQTGQDYVLYLPQSSEYVVLNRAGAFNLNIVATSNTGYFAVQDFFGNIVIHANGGAELDYANESATVWPCFSSTDAFRYGSIVDLQAGGIQGFAGSVDVSLLVNLTQIVASDGAITDVTISSAQTQLTQVALYNNGMGSTEVNAILIALDSTGATGGTVSITGNSAPTGGGATAKTNLQGKGWIVETD